jgi:hypothetical protein
LSNASIDLKIQFFMRSYLLYFNSLGVPLKIILRAALGARAVDCRRLA